MEMTDSILREVFEKNGWTVHRTPARHTARYGSIRMYYPGCDCRPGALYVAKAAGAPQGWTVPDADLCLLGVPEEAPEGELYLVEAPCGIVPFYSAVLERLEELDRWDREMTGLLMGECSFQDILDCSAPFLHSPCFFQDLRFNVLASAGELSPEDDPFFYETLRTGRAPTRFLEELLKLPPEERAMYIPSGTVSAVHSFSKGTELLANCMVNGAPVLRFGLFCPTEQVPVLRDIVGHMMRRLQNSPVIHSLASSGEDVLDCLFTRLIDVPNDPLAGETAQSLGLYRFDRFVTLCVDFRAGTSEVPAMMAKLRVLYPFSWFFTYGENCYALLGLEGRDDPEGEPIGSTGASLLQHLDSLHAVCGISHSFTSPASLGAACAQARFALEALLGSPAGGEQGEARTAVYQEQMLGDIILSFFRQHPFRDYCPQAVRDMIGDDQRMGTNNTQLLYTYLANNCNATETARALYMHRNNVLYRIDKIRARYHVDLSDHQQRSLLFLLCLAAQYKLDQG